MLAELGFKLTTPELTTCVTTDALFPDADVIEMSFSQKVVGPHTDIMCHSFLHVKVKTECTSILACLSLYPFPTYTQFLMRLQQTARKQCGQRRNG